MGALEILRKIKRKAEYILNEIFKKHLSKFVYLIISITLVYVMFRVHSHLLPTFIAVIISLIVFNFIFICIEAASELNDQFKLKYLSGFIPSKYINKIDASAKTYILLLHNLIKKPDINNIAITGDFCVGKSSIVQSYEWQYGKKFIYVSVSDLLQTKKLKGKELQEEIEKNLLKQLLAICKKNDIPTSHFMSIPESPSKIKNILYALFIALSSLMLGIVLLWDKITEAITIDVLRNQPKFIQIFMQIINIDISKYTEEYLKEKEHCIEAEKYIAEKLASYQFTAYVILILMILILLTATVYTIIRHYKLPKILAKAAAANGSEAGVEFNTVIAPESLDKNLEEIIYLMERVGRKSGNVLVIEDMDRFPADVSIPVLVKLKQINMIINQRIRFKTFRRSFKSIYVLKEDIFQQQEKDQYKFFDVILHIAPKLSHSSSSFYLQERWSHFEIDSNFIYIIAPYLTDYRRIADIENEYITSTNIHNKYLYSVVNVTANRTIYTELMAMIIYKTYFPNDYYKIRCVNQNGQPESFLEKSLDNVWEITLPVFTSNNDSLKNILIKHMSQRVFHFVGGYAISAVNKAKSYYHASETTDDIYVIESNLHEIEKIIVSMNCKEIYPRTFQLTVDFYLDVILIALNKSPMPKRIYFKALNLFETYKIQPQKYDHFLNEAYRLLKSDADVVNTVLNIFYNKLYINKIAVFNDLTNANLSKISVSLLEEMFLRNVKYNSNTIFPKGFDPKAHGMIDISAQPEPETNDSESTTPIT